MKVSEADLLKSGFTDADLKKIKNNLESYGGTLGEAVADLKNRFRVLLWIISGCTLVFIFLLCFSTKTYIRRRPVSANRGSHSDVYSTANAGLEVMALLPVE